MEALILAVIITYAIKKAVENGHLHWQGTKSANRRSTRGRSVPKRAASAVQHDIGYWAHQILNGFPQARQGLRSGWHAGRTAQAQGTAEREKARTNHLETRARLIPQIREQRRRQDEAMAEIRRQWQPEGSEGSDEEATPAPADQVPEEDTPAAPGDGTPAAADDEATSQGTPAPASTENTEGTTMASDTTYDGVISRMGSAIAAAEERGQEASAAKNWANQTADEMQSLNLDPATLGAMADHLDALDAAEKAQQRVIESAQDVDANLKRGHAGLAEAHQNAPVEAADREFYAG